MKKLLLILALLVSCLGIAQEKDNYKNAVTSFQNHYNNGDVTSIFNMFDNNFKQVLTLEKTKAYFTKEVNMEALGKIKSIEYKDTVRSGNNYTITFDKGVYNGYFLLGTDNKFEFIQLDLAKK
ncbi:MULTISPECIES: DUF3887 domain-containing protein [unclassified Olleya]|mgnify:FL=1|jgi:hypothetical protein|uniref:DUF3887 domain-containing protein n=1 Tax=unclassified Olleya TaxID=2615019 RepID=UPI0011A1CC8E|nr:DUF3887 domain-containing protein [Olleya sp. Hel_I_94]TVZ48451.1 uncharacterized protein DUF3887 [Olleya sp. Hel_I_94]|tara:strand:- start:117230 stop:117598 length:369 start_codon:yes stop_codon:yes gene_type:complete